MKKVISILISMCMMFSLFGGVVLFDTFADEYTTLKLNGFSTWTQAELDSSSGNNGYANSCSTSLHVVTDSQYIVGDATQAIKAVFGNSGTSYNNCVVNWKYGTGGPCTAGNVWAPADGSDIYYEDYDGIRIAVLNSKGEPANFSQITLRVTVGWNYSSNMRYWDSAVVRDDEGYFYFDFESFAASGSPEGDDIYDYMKNTARGISMLCYGGSDENTCYYSSVELYRSAGDTVRKNGLIALIEKLEGYETDMYDEEIAAAQAVVDDPAATQDQVEAQSEIIQNCITEYNEYLVSGYTYAQLDGIQNWTEDEASSMNGFGSTYSISDKALLGDAKQSMKLTSVSVQDRFCFATQKSNGSFSTVNPYKLTNEADGKLSDYDGIAIAFCDENGEQIELSKFTARLMRDANDWGSYWLYEASYTDFDECYINGYYHLSFADYPNLAGGAVDNLSIMSILFYKSVAVGDVAYISDMKAYKDNGPIPEYEYLQLNGVQTWTEEHLAQTSANNGHLNNVTATYSISDLWTVGEAAQSIKAVKSSASADFNCLVNKAYDSNDIAAPSPWVPSDGISKLSHYDGVMIAVKDNNGNLPVASKVRLRLLINPAANGWGVFYESSVYTRNADGYLVFEFKDFPSYDNLMREIDTAAGISLLINDSGQTEYYFSDFKAFREKREIDVAELQKAVDLMKNNNEDGRYDAEIEASEALINDPLATQADINAQLALLNRILRSILLKPVEFDEDNIVLSFGAVSDIHITESVSSSNTKKYENALQLLKKYAGGELDAITIAGDISSSTYSSGIGTAFTTITDQEMGEDANVFFVSGNHDAQNSEWATLNQFYSDLSKYTANDLSTSQHSRGNRHMVINGYHYLAVNMMDYWNGSEAKFDTRDLEWLADELEAARSDAPGQPIFVYVHAGVYGTTYGSDLYTGTYWGSKAIYSYLENYPEVVTFSGHVHFPLADERTIYQNDFTSLNCGSVQYMAIENGYLQTGGKTTCDDSWGVSSGLLVQVDQNNNLKITRLDFANDSVIKQPFYISAPDLENKSNLLHYNSDYFNLDNTAPVFAENANVTAELSGSNVSVTFDAASDNDMVHHYVFEIKGLPSGRVTTAKAFSEFYLYPTAAMFPDSYTMKVPYTAVSGDDAFEISVYAVDSMGMKSEPITYNSVINEVNIPTSQGENLINIDFITGSPRNNTTIQCTINNSDAEIVKFGPKYGYAPSADAKLTFKPGNSVNTLSARKFVVDVAFTVGELGSEQHIFGSLNDDKGYSLYLTAEGKIAFVMYTASGKFEVITNAVVAEDEFHDVIVVFSNGAVSVYVDGVMAGSAEVSGNAVFPNTPYYIGARNNGIAVSDPFNGIIYQVGIGSNVPTAEEIAARHVKYVTGMTYKGMQRLYDEIAYVSEVLALYGENDINVTTICENYIAELTAALAAIPMDSEWVSSVIRTENFKDTLSIFSVDVDFEQLAAPAVSGVEDGASYELNNGEVVISWDNATNAELNFTPIKSGLQITEAGSYQLLVQNKYASTVVEFTVTKTYELPVVSGVEEGAQYDLYLGQIPAITFDVGEATLNGEAYVSGTPINAVGEYVFKVVNGDKEVTVAFAVIDTTPQYMKGDFDGDETISVADALYALRIAAKLSEGTEMDLNIGDIDGDGSISVADALAILRVAAKLSDEL